MFERFTDRARRVVVLAQEEARALDHNYVGTEHILLGLIHEGQGLAAKALESMGISLESVRQQIEEIIGRGKQASAGHIPFTPRAKKVLELSLRESVLLGHNYIGTEHILLGLIHEGEGVAAQVLVRLGADLDRVRLRVIQLLAGYQSPGPEVRAVRARPFPPRGRFSHDEEVIRMLADVSARLRAVEEHLGLRRPGEGAQAGQAAAAEAEKADAGHGEVTPAGEGPGGAKSEAGEPGGARSEGGEPGGARSEGGEPGGARSEGGEPGGARSEGEDPGGARSEGGEPGGVKADGAADGDARPGAPEPGDGPEPPEG
jgi:hypothetical protein